MAIVVLGIALKLNAAEIRFQDITPQSGLLKPLQGMMGHGGAWGDVDGDGLIDLYVGGFADRPNADYAPAAGPPRNQLLRNMGQGRFAVVTNSPANHFARTSGAVFADLDNDGDLDLYVGNNGRPGRASKTTGPQRAARLALSKLYRNDRGRLVDISAASKACPAALESGRNIGVFDYDADGRLDLLVVEDRFTKGPSTRLFRNEGDLTFRDVTQAAGLPEDLFGLGLAVADVNGDRRPDFFVPHSNRFFLSDGRGRYTEPPTLREVFAWAPLHNEDWPCGASFGDLDNDGDLDLVLSIHCQTARNRVYLNDGVQQGVPRFRDVTPRTGLPAHLPVKAPHVEIQDFDNDGRPDLYFSSAVLRQGRTTPVIFRNLGMKNGVPQFAPNVNPAEANTYYAAGPSGDFDNDGRVDLCLINWFRGDHTRLLRNVSGTHHWLKVSVRGQRMNRMGLGARLTVWQGQERLGLQELQIGYGYASGQPAVAHFGLGAHARVTVEVLFPDGRRVRQTAKANQHLIIQEAP